RFPRPGQRRHPALHDAAAPGGPVALHQFPRRGPLGLEAAQQRILAPRGVWLAQEACAPGANLRWGGLRVLRYLINRTDGPGAKYPPAPDLQVSLAQGSVALNPYT